MTLPALTPRILLTGTGTLGPFSLTVGGQPLRFTSNSHIVVTRFDSAGTATAQVEGTHYTLTGGPDAGALTLIASPLTASDKLLIERVQPFVQELAIGSAQAFPSAAVEARLDKLTEYVQDLNVRVGRTIQVNALDTVGYTLPTAAARASKVLSFDSSGALVAVDGTGTSGGTGGGGGGTVVAYYGSIGADQLIGTGDGVTTSFTYTGQNVADASSMFVRVGGAWMPTSAYGVAISGGNTIVTFTTAPPTGALIHARAIVLSAGGGGGGGGSGGDMFKADNLSGLANVATARANLGFSTFGGTLGASLDAAAARTTLGFSAVGVSLATAIDAAAARTAIGAAAASGSSLALHNRVINGGFNVNQSEYASGTPLSANAYGGHDRWKAGASGCTYTFSGAAVETTITIATGSLLQIVAGANLPEGGSYTLAWTGTAQGRVNGASYAASPVTVTGLAANTNMTIEFNVGTVGQVRLAPGSTAAAWSPRMREHELDLCREYLQVWGTGTTFETFGAGSVNTSTTAHIPIQFFKLMRAAPTVTFNSNLSFSFHAVDSTYDAVPSSITADLIGRHSFRVVGSGFSTWPTGMGVVLRAAGSNAKITARAEL